MAVTYGFFNSVNGDRKYNADQMSEYFRGIVSQGVFQHLDSGMAVSAGTGLSVSVAAGRAIIQNRWVQNSAALNLTISDASETYGRKDAVVIRLDKSSRAISIAVKTGTPAASPVAPSMTRNETTYEMALAHVTVAAGASSVTVTDKRSDSSVCGWAAVAQATSGEVDQMLNDMKTGFDGVTYNSPAAMVQGSDELLDDKIMLIPPKSSPRNLLTADIKTYGQARSYGSGAIIANANYLCYYPIPVSPNTDYFFMDNRGSIQTHVAFYDINKNYISGFLTGFFKHKLTTPDNAFFMSFSPNYNGNETNVTLMPMFERYSDVESNYSLDYSELYPIKFGDLKGIPGTFKKICNKNLLDKDSALDNYYVRSSNADPLSQSDYKYAVVPVEVGKTYTPIGLSNNHWAILNSDGSYSRGGAGSPTNWEITGDEAFLCVSIKKSTDTAPAVCEGDVAIYSPFGSGDVYSFTGVSLLSVGANKTYQTIASAISAASPGDIIIVYPGTYTESLQITKDIVIVGTDREKCILTYGAKDYNHPPMNVCAGVVVRNMTIKATNSGTEGSSNTAYCVHIDNDGFKNKSAYFENVKFINEWHQAIGIGLRPNSTVEFDNCHIESQTGRCALYCHDWETSSSEDKSGQHLIVKNCTLKNGTSGQNLEKPIRLQSQEKQAACATATFQRNIVRTSGNTWTADVIQMFIWDGRTPLANNYLGSGDWVLDTDSYLNSNSQIDSE